MKRPIKLYWGDELLELTEIEFDQLCNSAPSHIQRKLHKLADQQLLAETLAELSRLRSYAPKYKPGTLVLHENEIWVIDKAVVGREGSPTYSIHSESNLQAATISEEEIKCV